MKQVFPFNDFTMKKLISEMIGDGQDDSLVAVDVFDIDGDPQWGFTETCEELFLQMSGRKPQKAFEAPAFDMPIKILEETHSPTWGMPHRTIVRVRLLEL